MGSSWIGGEEVNFKPFLGKEVPLVDYRSGRRVVVGKAVLKENEDGDIGVAAQVDDGHADLFQYSVPDFSVERQEIAVVTPGSNVQDLEVLRNQHNATVCHRQRVENHFKKVKKTKKFRRTSAAKSRRNNRK